MKLKSLVVALSMASAFNLMGAASGVMATPTAVVVGVQMPAWVERGGTRQPLAAGMELQASDKVSTGANSRLLLRLAEGSEVKLGENALLSLDKLAQRQENKSTFLEAAIDVVRGAFRFTTDAKAKIASRRQVDIRVTTVTAGIRGTDLWGKSAADRDIVCLIEGKIQVQREAEAPVNMDQALQFYISAKGADGKADASKKAVLAAVDSVQLTQWATETEIAAGQGAARKGGKWKVVAASHDNQAGALQLYDRLRAAGYAAEIHPMGTPDKRSYQVRIGNLPSQAEAEALGAKVDAVTGGRSSTAA